MEIPEYFVYCGISAGKSWGGRSGQIAKKEFLEVPKKKGNPIPAESNCPDGRLKNTHTPPRYFRDNRQSCEFSIMIKQNAPFVKQNYTKTRLDKGNSFAVFTMER